MLFDIDVGLTRDKVGAGYLEIDLFLKSPNTPSSVGELGALGSNRSLQRGYLLLEFGNALQVRVDVGFRRR